MEASHTVRPVFDEANLLAHAGLVPALALARRHRPRPVLRRPLAHSSHLMLLLGHQTKIRSLRTTGGDSVRTPD